MVQHMEPIVATVREDRRDAVSGGASGSDRIQLEKVELKDDTDVSPWPSQPSVTGSRPSRTSPRHVAKLVGGLR